VRLCELPHTAPASVVAARMRLYDHGWAITGTPGCTREIALTISFLAPVSAGNWTEQ